MGIHEIGRIIDNKLQVVNSKINKNLNGLERVKSISNTSLQIINNKTNDATTPKIFISNCIEACKNNVTQDGVSVNWNNKANAVSNNSSNQKINESKSSNKTTDFNNIDKSPKEENNSIDIKNIKKFPDWIFNTGINGLSTEQKLIFKKEKTRSFKNLLKPFISPIKFINRSLLPIKINFENILVNKPLGEFKFDNESNNNDAFITFSNKLKKLNETFIDNIGNVRRKKVLGHKKIDIVIKYETLERALECKLFNDIKILSDEFKTELAKNKFQENYADLPNKISSNLDFIFNSNIDGLFSSDVVYKLSVFLKKEINNQSGKINIHNVVNNAINSVLGQKDKIITEFTNYYESIKNEISLNLTKELFKNLSKETAFIGEQDAIIKVDDLIKKVKDNITEKMGKPTDKIINYLKNSFYENIKPSDDGDNLLIRLFKNSSNNIHYKWAQDAVLLLINYETFENKDGQISSTNYTSHGVVEYGGDGSERKQKTMIETILGGIYSRLGLSNENLDESKDEVLRKYFANYF